MLASERQNQILALIEERGSVRTVDMAEEFAVTDETIRRDLQVLSDARRITRIHGGATSLSGRPKLRSFTERRIRQVGAKQAIARAALEKIEPGRTYAFDSSTTAFELVDLLPDLPLRVVTNAYAVLDRLVAHDRTELISTGGRYHPKTQTFVGGDSIENLKRHNVHTAFVSCVGLDLKRGASEGFEEQVAFKERLVNWADEVVLLVDSSKFGERSEYFFAEIGAFRSVITDGGAAPSFIEALRGRGVEVTVAG
jgi:DeoR/GlpR family transcriptional regulator of sugar metabolism